MQTAISRREEAFISQPFPQLFPLLGSSMSLFAWEQVEAWTRKAPCLQLAGPQTCTDSSFDLVIVGVLITGKSVAQITCKVENKNRLDLSFQLSYNRWKFLPYICKTIRFWLSYELLAVWKPLLPDTMMQRNTMLNCKTIRFPSKEEPQGFLLGVLSYLFSSFSFATSSSHASYSEANSSLCMMVLKSSVTGFISYSPQWEILQRIR